eukprot:4714922-Pyramimonas_sp.AAC.2
MDVQACMALFARCACVDCIGMLLPIPCLSASEWRERADVLQCWPPSHVDKGSGGDWPRYEFPKRTICSLVVDVETYSEQRILEMRRSTSFTLTSCS